MMVADPRYYLAAVVLYGAVFFLQPASTASSVGLIHRVNASAMVPLFRLFSPVRSWLAAIGLTTSLIAPTLFGVHPIGPIMIGLGCFMITVADFRQLTALAKNFMESERH